MHKKKSKNKNIKFKYDLKNFVPSVHRTVNGTHASRCIVHSIIIIFKFIGMIHVPGMIPSKVHRYII